MEESGDWLVRLEVSIFQATGWSLHDIDETDVEHLLAFVEALPSKGGKSGPVKKRVFVDQVNWL